MEILKHKHHKIVQYFRKYTVCSLTELSELRGVVWHTVCWSNRLKTAPSFYSITKSIRLKSNPQESKSFFCQQKRLKRIQANAHFLSVSQNCDRDGAYLRPPHVSADPARVYSRTENPIRLQLDGHTATHHV